MAFTVVFSTKEIRDYGVFDSFEVTDSGVLIIEMKREDVSRHFVAPGAWLEVVEIPDGHPAKTTRGIIAHGSRS
jgi:hypothetical protein